jgi:heme-degrading monooxygenase HmoA
MHVIAFRYLVDSEHVERFERVYGSDGDWARFFATGEGYLGTQLLRSAAGDYLLLDRWESAASFDAFMRDHGAAYEQRSRRTVALYEREERLGAFDLVEPSQ